MDMAIQRDNTDERESRLNILIEQFRTAEKTALLKRGIALWTHAEAQRGMARHEAALPLEKIN